MTADRLILFDLVAAVQRRVHGSDQWRTVAAFDLVNVAEAHADDWRAGRADAEYRVVPLEPDATKCRVDTRIGDRPFPAPGKRDKQETSR